MDLVDLYKPVTPGPTALAMIDGSGGQRYLCLASLRVADGICKWCEQKPLRTKRHHYCSVACSQTANWEFSPQDPCGKAYLFVQKQNCVCPGCGECFEEEIEGLVADLYDKEKRIAECTNMPVKKVSLCWLGRRMGWEKPKDPKSTWHIDSKFMSVKFEIDHVIPIHRGGLGAGYSNLQVLCVPCHREKSKRDGSEFRKSQNPQREFNDLEEK